MGTNQRRRFLVVDNNEQESRALVQVLESLGHKASATWSGKDALDYLASDRFDLLLVDEYVADMYVGEFIKRVHRLPNHPRVAVLKRDKRFRSIKCDKSLEECQFFDKELDQLYQTLRTEFAESYDRPIN
jgi:CheY-like chemotaxis protein